MTYPIDYWRDNPDAPYAALMEIVAAYCHPENMDWPGLHDLVNDPAKYNAEDDVRRFKRELHELLTDPDKIPRAALSDAADFGDGTEERFLKRLWRELYPDEPVPGGDEEFRNDLIAVMRGEKNLYDTTVSEYTAYYSRLGMTHPEFARLVWQKKYPDEPLPVESGE